MIELIIQDKQGQWKHLDLENLDIVLSKKLTDLSDPSKIACGYSLGVVLPITDNNNAVLGRLYGFDHVDGSTVTFSQKDRHAFKLLNGAETLYEGNFVLDSISTSYEDGTHYDVTLYDEMAGIYQRLDYTLGTPAPSADGGDDMRNIQSLHCPLTPAFVKADWEGGTDLATILDANDECDITAAKHHSVVGVLPTEREWDNMEKDRMICDDETDSADPSKPLIVSFRNQMPSDSYPTEYSSVGAMMWKVYHLKPYVYIKPLWEFIASEIRRVSGYRVSLSGSFFSTRNPYWTRGIYTAHYLTAEDETVTVSKVLNRAVSADIANGSSTIQTEVLANRIEVAQLDPAQGVTLHHRIRTEILFKALQSASVTYSLNHDGYVVLRVYTKGYAGGTGTTLQDTQYFLASEDSPLLETWKETIGEQYVITVPTQTADTRAGNYIGLNDQRNRSAKPTVPEYYTEFEVSHFIGSNFLSDYDDLGVEVTIRPNGLDVAEESVAGTFSHMAVMLDVTTTAEQRDEVPVMTWTSLLGEDWNVQREFCKLLKIFNLVAVPDSASRTISILTRGDFYSGGTVDWTHRIHAEETIESTDILSDNNTLLYTYEENESPLNTAAHERDGAANNSHRLVLPYANEEGTTNVIEGLHNSDILKEETYYWGDCENKVLQHRTATPYVYYDNKEDGTAMEERIGQILFRNPDNLPLGDFTQFGRAPYPVVSRDSQYERDNEEYMYHVLLSPSSLNASVPSAFPDFGYYAGRYGSEWSIGLYDTFHKNWNLLMYHQGNRLMTAEVTLSYEDYRQFSFRKTVIIDNSIYLPLEIEEYALNNSRARVRLLRIGDATLLRNIDHYFGQDYLTITPTVVVTHQGSNTIHAMVHSTKAWTQSAQALPSWLSSATISPSSGTAGATSVTITLASTTALMKAAEATLRIGTTDGMEAVLYAANVAPYIAPHDTITVTPSVQTVVNAAGESVSTVINVRCLGEWKYTIGAGGVVDTTGAIANVQPGEWTDARQLVLANLLSVRGDDGDTQTITFTSRSGKTATFTWVRAEAHFVYLEGGDVQTWEYCTEGSGLVSEYEFSMRCTYPWLIRGWVNRHLTDDATGESAFEKAEGDPVLYVDGTPYAADEEVHGEAGRTYSLRWEYPRRQGAPDPYSDFYYTIACENDEFEKIVEVFVNKINNNQ